jgi:hypothetical protein
MRLLDFLAELSGNSLPAGTDKAKILCFRMEKNYLYTRCAFSKKAESLLI